EAPPEAAVTQEQLRKDQLPQDQLPQEQALPAKRPGLTFTPDQRAVLPPSTPPFAAKQAALAPVFDAPHAEPTRDASPSVDTSKRPRAALVFSQTKPVTTPVNPIWHDPLKSDDTPLASLQIDAPKIRPDPALTALDTQPLTASPVFELAHLTRPKPQQDRADEPSKRPEDAPVTPHQLAHLIQPTHLFAHDTQPARHTDHAIWPTLTRPSPQPVSQVEITLASDWPVLPLAAVQPFVSSIDVAPSYAALAHGQEARTWKE
ncbi:MAG: hypothetical protein ABI459_08380, partial [Deltaproteobacteria bacterium]